MLYVVAKKPAQGGLVWGLLTCASGLSRLQGPVLITSMLFGAQAVEIAPEAVVPTTQRMTSPYSLGTAMTCAWAAPPGSASVLSMCAGPEGFEKSRAARSGAADRFDHVPVPATYAAATAVTMSAAIVWVVVICYRAS